MIFSGEIPIPGVRGLEHTADIGLEVEGADLRQVFVRGGLGAMWLVMERGPELKGGEGGEGTEERTLNLTEEDLPALFRSWLRALLYWEETEGFVFTDAALAFLPVPLCSAPDGQAFGLQARLEGGVDLGPRIREIKGVTLHNLVLERRGGGWYGRVIFDV